MKLSENSKYDFNIEMWIHCESTHLDENKEHPEIQGKEQSSMA